MSKHQTLDSQSDSSSTDCQKPEDHELRATAEYMAERASTKATMPVQKQSATQSEFEEERKCPKLQALELGKLVAGDGKWIIENPMRKCLITGCSMQVPKGGAEWGDGCLNLSGKGSRIMFKFGKTSPYLGRNPSAQISLDLVCYGFANRDCLVEVSING